MIDLMLTQTLYTNKVDPYYNLDIENKNELFSFTIELTLDYKFISIYVNSKTSINDMFPKFSHSLDIKIPQTLINLLLPNRNMPRAILGYTLLKEYIRQKE